MGVQAVRVQSGFRLVGKAINNSGKIGLQSSAAGMVKGRDPITGDVLIRQLDPHAHLIGPPREKATAVFVRTVLLIDVVPAMKGFSHLRDNDSVLHRQIVIVPHHVERQVRRPPAIHRLTI